MNQLVGISINGDDLASVVESWDWHYRIAFDDALRVNIKFAAGEIQDSPSAGIFWSGLETWTNLLSVSCLVQAVVENPKDAEAYIRTAESRKALYMPQFLADRYAGVVKEIKSLGVSEKRRLLDIIASASCNSFENFHREIFSPVFGETLNVLLREASSREVLPPVDSPIDLAQLRASVEVILDDILASVPPLLRPLTTYIPEFDIRIEKGQGFAEYWPRSLTKKSKAELLVFETVDQLGYRNLRATIAHEIIGHASFYGLSELSAPSFYDHGAMALIEGWATWCEWKVADVELGRALRLARCNSLTRFDAVDPIEIQRSIRSFAHLQGYSDAVADASIEYFFQYPGFNYSYALGALWFERKFAAVTPSEFFSGLRGKAWGDFFAAW